MNNTFASRGNPGHIEDCSGDVRDVQCRFCGARTISLERTLEDRCAEPSSGITHLHAAAALKSCKSTHTTLRRALDDADLVVQAFNEAEGDCVLRFAVSGDAVPMPLDDGGEVIVRGETLAISAVRASC